MKNFRKKSKTLDAYNSESVRATNSAHIPKDGKFHADAHRALKKIRTIIFSDFMAFLVWAGEEIMDRDIQAECGELKRPNFFEIFPFYQFLTHF